MMPPEVKKYLSRNIQSQFDKDPAIHWILTYSLFLAFSFFIISSFIFHQIQHPGTVLNAELHEDFETGITFCVWADIDWENQV